MVVIFLEISITSSSSLPHKQYQFEFFGLTCYPLLLEKKTIQFKNATCFINQRKSTKILDGVGIKKAS